MTEARQGDRRCRQCWEGWVREGTCTHCGKVPCESCGDLGGIPWCLLCGRAVAYQLPQEPYARLLGRLGAYRGREAVLLELRARRSYVRRMLLDGTLTKVQAAKLMQMPLSREAQDARRRLRKEQRRQSRAGLATV
jgi:hypothetical protein